MNGKFNIDIDKMVDDLYKQGVEDRKLFEKYDTEFKKAAEILLQNQKDCEQFKGRDGI